MLKITDLRAYYGQINALHGIKMEIPAGKMTCIIGSNGAGKTTLLKSISGSIKRTGSILFNGETELIHMSPQKVAKQFIAHVPEGRHHISRADSTGKSGNGNHQLAWLFWE